MPGKYRVCSEGELELGAVRRVEVEGKAIAVVRCAGGVRAVSDVCSHEDYSLSEGEVDAEACEIECWKHGSMFSLETGEPLTLPATLAIKVFEVVEDGDDIWVVLP